MIYFCIIIVTSLPYKAQVFSSPSDLMKSTVVDESLSTNTTRVLFLRKTTLLLKCQDAYDLVSRCLNTVQTLIFGCLDTYNWYTDTYFGYINILTCMDRVVNLFWCFQTPGQCPDTYFWISKHQERCLDVCCVQTLILMSGHLETYFWVFWWPDTCHQYQEIYFQFWMSDTHYSVSRCLSSGQRLIFGCLDTYFCVSTPIYGCADIQTHVWMSAHCAATYFGCLNIQTCFEHLFL